MPIPAQLQRRLKAPVIVSPMFLVSGPDLVVAACKSGFVGTFPSLNQRTTEGYAAWLSEIQEKLGPEDAPFGVNLVVHKSNSRLQADLAKTVEHKVPLVITSLGAVKEVIDAVHSYGGLVFHDIIHLVHARKAAGAGVDGLIGVSAGAGGHAGTVNPFALVSEIRAFFAGTIILAGAMNTGAQVAAARMMGADFAYMGTRFIATRESLAQTEFKTMITASNAADIVYTPAISGVFGNFLRASIVAAGRDPTDMSPSHGGLSLEGEAKVWKDIWSAGQGSGGIGDIPSAAELCTRIAAEHRAALESAGAQAKEWTR